MGSEWGSWDQGLLPKMVPGPGTIVLGTRTICSVFIGTRDQSSKVLGKVPGWDQGPQTKAARDQGPIERNRPGPGTIVTPHAEPLQ